MQNNEKTNHLVDSKEVPKHLQSHQDYANWELTGRRFRLLNLDWYDLYSEAEEVISVNGEPCVCETCLKVGPGLKMTTNTPSFHNSTFSICLACTKKAYESKGGKVIPDEEIFRLFWQAISEGGLADDVMNEADVYPDNLGVDEDGIAYEFEAGDPVSSDDFTVLSQAKIVDSWGGMKGILEKLHDEGYHTYCIRDPAVHDTEDREEDHIWDGDELV